MPHFKGCCTTGVQKVLSMTVNLLYFFASETNFSKSTQVKIGLDEWKDRWKGYFQLVRHHLNRPFQILCGMRPVFD